MDAAISTSSHSAVIDADLSSALLARHRIVQILDQARTRYRFLLIGYVLMPEHVHLLLSEPKKGLSSLPVRLVFGAAQTLAHRPR